MRRCARGGARIAAAIAALLALKGFAAPLDIDLTQFKPKPANQRQMREAEIRWIVRPNADEYCAQITGAKGYVRPRACVFWNVQQGECTLVTTAPTTHSQLGHVMRRCFEGVM